MKLLFWCCLSAFVAHGVLAIDCKWDPSNTCSCTYTSDGKDYAVDITNYIDWSKTTVDGPAGDPQYVYQYSPCQQTKCVGGTETNGHACQFQKGKSQTDHFYYIAGDISTWTIDKPDPTNLQFTIAYKAYTQAGHDRSTKVKFSYADSADTFAFSDSSNALTVYNFAVTGKKVAPTTPTPSPHTGGGGGGHDVTSPIGWVLISLAIVGLITYFVAGGLINYYHRGARGVEVIPNWAFWKDLPFLIKDGFMFTISPCYKREKSYQTL